MDTVSRIRDQILGLVGEQKFPTFSLFTGAMLSEIELCLRRMLSSAKIDQLARELPVEINLVGSVVGWIGFWGKIAVNGTTPYLSTNVGQLPYRMPEDFPSSLAAMKLAVIIWDELRRSEPATEPEGYAEAWKEACDSGTDSWLH